MSAIGLVSNFLTRLGGKAEDINVGAGFGYAGPRAFLFDNRSANLYFTPIADLKRLE